MDGPPEHRWGHRARTGIAMKTCVYFLVKTLWFLKFFNDVFDEFLNSAYRVAKLQYHHISYPQYILTWLSSFDRHYYYTHSEGIGVEKYQLLKKEYTKFTHVFERLDLSLR